jgi:RNA polymerase sigma-70 factor, ECF subfamily
MNTNKETQFKEIVDGNKERITRICRYYNPNAEDQKDMYQEVLLNVWKSLDNFRGDSKISTWVYRIAINTSLNFTGKAFKQMKLIVDKDVQTINVLADDDLRLKKQYETDLDMLQTQLNQLTVIEKAMMSLLLEGLPMREIADVIGLTETNTRVKIHRIKDKLKERVLESKISINHEK